MTQQRKPATKTAKPADKRRGKPTAGKGTPPDPSKPSAAERYTVKTEFWETLLDSLPPWGDEIAAILLIVFGVVSFLSLINVSGDATISAAWSNALTGLFGWGSAIICGGVFGLGVIILLRKLDVVINFPTRRILAIEIAFLSMLALLHLAVGDPELRNLARAGRGGGQVGWALSASVAGLFGTTVATVFYVIVFVISIAVVIGIKRDHLVKTLTRADEILSDLAKRYQPEPRQPRARVSLDEGLRPVETTVVIGASGAPVVQKVSDVAAQRVKLHSIMRIRPEIDSLPPSLRPGAQPLAVDPEDADEALDLSQHPLFKHVNEEKELISSVGTVKPTRKKGAPTLVERPDGRVKRYFSVENIKEAKQIGKRDPSVPPLSLLDDVEFSLPDEQEINNNVALIENTLLEFDIDVDVVDVKVGPTVTQYLIRPFRDREDDPDSKQSRTRISKIASLANDLALSLSAKRLRLETPVPGTNYIGVEVPNRVPSIVALRSVYESKTYYELAQKKKSPLFIPLGRDVAGVPVGVDLATMPHLLIAGTTGSGKSVCIAAIAASLVLDNTPDQVKLVMLDPKMVELSRFNGLPHLLGPVETETERIIGVLRWCTREMDRRYKLLEENAARNIDTYNQRLGRRRRDEYMPYIVILIDEIGDLMMTQPEETERTITRLAQMARAVGMHLIVATQRPSVDVITGLIKANFPSRISFAVASGTDSRVILDTIGAETLMGRGDMLYQASDMFAPRRVQGCWINDDEVRLIVHHWRQWAENYGDPDRRRVGPWERGLTRRELLSETDPMLEQAIDLVIAEQEASASLIQRRLGLGYPRAARIIDLMEQLGIIGKQLPGARNREVLIKPGKDPFKEIIDKRLSDDD